MPLHVSVGTYLLIPRHWYTTAPHMTDDLVFALYRLNTFSDAYPGLL